MAITIDYSDPAQYIIEIPRADLALVQSTPVEIRQLDVDQFRLSLHDLQDEPEHIWAPTSFSSVAPITVAGVQLARVLEILDPYVIRFEDDLYNVNIVGGNSNIADKTIKNQVGVNTANSAGLTFSDQINEQSFQGAIWINTISGLPGTGFPRGTPTDPSSNWTDAEAIANNLGLENFRLAHTLVMPTSEGLDEYTITGNNPTGSIIVFQGGTCSRLSLVNLSFAGAMGDGFFSARECVVGTITNLDGGLFQCVLNGNITLDATPSGVADISFMNCVSGFPGDLSFTLDCNGTTANVQFRNWSGGLMIDNWSGGGDMSLDLSQGKVTINATCTSGTILIRGIGELIDNSGIGCTVIHDGLMTPEQLKELYQIRGLDPDNPVTVTTLEETSGDITLDITGDGTTTSTLTRQP